MTDIRAARSMKANDVRVSGDPPPPRRDRWRTHRESATTRHPVTDGSAVPTIRLGVVRVRISLRRADQTLATTIQRATIIAVCLANGHHRPRSSSRSITKPVRTRSSWRSATAKLDNGPGQGTSEVAHLGHAFQRDTQRGSGRRRSSRNRPHSGCPEGDLGRPKGTAGLGGHHSRHSFATPTRGHLDLPSATRATRRSSRCLNEYLGGYERSGLSEARRRHPTVRYPAMPCIGSDRFAATAGNGAASAVLRAASDMQGTPSASSKTKNEEVQKLNMGIGITWAATSSRAISGSRKTSTASSATRRIIACIRLARDGKTPPASS